MLFLLSLLRQLQPTQQLHTGLRRVPFLWHVWAGGSGTAVIESGWDYRFEADMEKNSQRPGTCKCLLKLKTAVLRREKKTKHSTKFALTFCWVHGCIVKQSGNATSCSWNTYTHRHTSAVITHGNGGEKNTAIRKFFTCNRTCLVMSEHLLLQFNVLCYAQEIMLTQQNWYALCDYKHWKPPSVGANLNKERPLVDSNSNTWKSRERGTVPTKLENKKRERTGMTENNSKLEIWRIHPKWIFGISFRWFQTWQVRLPRKLEGADISTEQTSISIKATSEF